MNIGLAGALFKTHRRKRQVPMQVIANQANITNSSISDFENGKKILSQERLTLLYQCLGMDYAAASDMNEFMNVLDQMIIDICCDSTVNVTYDDISKYENIVNFNECYFLYQLMQLLITIYRNDSFISEVKKNEIIKTLEANVDFVPLKYKAMVYDTLGICYDHVDYHKAIDYLKKGLHNVTRDELQALIFYHIGMNKNYHGELSEALELFTKAKIIFDEHLIYTRSLMCHIEIGIVYMQLGLSTKAEKNNLECIRYAKKKPELRPKLICAYNNLLWLYIRDKQYAKVLAYKDEVLALDPLNPNFLSYMGIAYYYLDDKEQAKLYLERTKEESVRATKNQMALMDVYLTMITRYRYREIENKIKIAYEYSVKDYDHQLQIFLLNLQIENLLNFQHNEQLSELQQLLNQKLMERK